MLRMPVGTVNPQVPILMIGDEGGVDGLTLGDFVVGYSRLVNGTWSASTAGGSVAVDTVTFGAGMYLATVPTAATDAGASAYRVGVKHPDAELAGGTRATTVILDVATSTRLAGSDYTTPATPAEIRAAWRVLGIRRCR